MRRSGRSVAVLVVLVGVFTATARPVGWRGPAAEGEQIEAEWRLAAEVNAFNRHLAADLAAGRIGLAEAADRVVEANADRPGYLASLNAAFPAPTVRESVARSLVHRAEHPLAPGASPAPSPVLRAEYETMFHRAYPPPYFASSGPPAVASVP